MVEIIDIVVGVEGLLTLQTQKLYEYFPKYTFADPFRTNEVKYLRLLRMQ